MATKVKVGAIARDRMLPNLSPSWPLSVLGVETADGFRSDLGAADIWANEGLRADLDSDYAEWAAIGV